MFYVKLHNLQNISILSLYGLLLRIDGKRYVLKITNSLTKSLIEKFGCLCVLDSHPAARTKQTILLKMDRSIPDVWNIFSMSGPNYGQGSHSGRTHHLMKDGFHVNWSSYDHVMLQKWCDR